MRNDVMILINNKQMTVSKPGPDQDRQIDKGISR
jgi:hypothetical protein